MNSKIVELILAIVLPPIAVYMKKGFSFHLVLNIILTIFGYVFGAVHALWIVLSERRSEIIANA